MIGRMMKGMTKMREGGYSIHYGIGFLGFLLDFRVFAWDYVEFVEG